jgi:peptidoglycan hydrolase CwlO-like protein
MAELNADNHGRRIVSTVLLSALVATASLLVVLVPRPAAAVGVNDLKAQATAISQKLIQEQLQIDAYRQQYSVTSERVAADARSITQIGQQIGHDRELINAKSRELRQQAIRSYVNAGAQASGTNFAMFSGSADRAQAASEYSSIAVGNITTVLDELRTGQSTLEVHEAALRQQQGRDRSDQTQRATALGQAGQTGQQLQAVQAQVTGKLATAVAQQAAAQQAAAASAVAAAQRTAVSTAPARSAPTTAPPASTSSTSGGSTNVPTTVGGTVGGTPGGGSTNTTDPALNPFLQCVVQAESGGNYGAVSPNGLYMGAFQFAQSTWDTAAQAAGRPDLVGVPPNRASKADQDTVAVALYALDGQQPWLGDRCSS